MNVFMTLQCVAIVNEPQQMFRIANTDGGIKHIKWMHVFFLISTVHYTANLLCFRFVCWCSVRWIYYASVEDVKLYLIGEIGAHVHEFLTFCWKIFEQNTSSVLWQFRHSNGVLYFFLFSLRKYNIWWPQNAMRDKQIHAKTVKDTSQLYRTCQIAWMWI